MESITGYWHRFVLPKIDLVSGRADYVGAFPEVLASFGASTVFRKAIGDQTLPPNLKGEATRRPRKQASTVTAGGLTTVT